MSELIQKLKGLRYRIFYGLLLRKAELVTLCASGSICPWTICPEGLNARSTVYSGGIGSDISFEHELVKKFGCEVVLCDPSPTGKKTMSLPENQLPQFHYFQLGLAGRRGKLKLSPPDDPQGDSWFASTGSSAQLEVECTDLSSLMKQGGHEHIDLLKLDIEGCEYEVIDQILESRLPVKQICVEYHHGILPGIRRSQTIKSMLRLITGGYRLIDQTGANHTFIQPKS
jgi:FkbM family methyltransferase